MRIYQADGTNMKFVLVNGVVYEVALIPRDVMGELTSSEHMAYADCLDGATFPGKGVSIIEELG